MSSKPTEPAAEILGYKLEKRIGSGGFGEVWAVEAPGGLKKALKIVYGFHDEKRAMAELKALDRVKSLRHPFLLSLERIEVFEGQLIVVTELADASLADHFNSYVAKGEPGIPREEMLSFMSNAAEALDFLSIEKSLQHLDVKPENLLLVGSHVKVADFGLMKDLKAQSQSLMQGMTPAYAAPELFDGAPAPSSDQYSLAIMYCEMISGVRPFPGTTPAQLAAQHVHGKPNLRPIPRGDHPAVARALSKDPGVRYPSCVAFVEELKKQRRSVRIARKRSERRSDDTSETLIYSKGDSTRGDMTEMISDRALPFQSSSMVSVEPPRCSGDKATIHPTLVITVGQTANRIGKKFKSKLLMRTGGTESVPAVRSLFIDSDRKDLVRLEGNDDIVSTLETLEVPLRKAEDYRARADVHLGWLSRRWIYNVPRTLQTEGLRPLGRLVFADYFTKICDRLEEVIAEFATEENLAETADKLGLNPGQCNSPRVYIVSSISGGVGSGMVLDLAYTVKLLLAEKGLNHDNIIGMLLHSTYQRARDPGLSSANAFAFLTEMRHFNEHGYPGDASLGIPEFDDEGPFQHTYYTELGDDLNQSEFEAKLDSVAEYISLSTTTRCNDFFEECRKSELEMEHFALRTMGVASTAAGEEDQRQALVAKLCHKLLQRWSGNGSELKENPSIFADGILSQLEVEPSVIDQKVRAQVTQSRSTTAEQIVAIAQQNAKKQQELCAAFNEIYGGLENEDEIPEGSSAATLRQAMDQFLSMDPVVGQCFVSKACCQLLNLDHLHLGDVATTVATIEQRFKDWMANIDQARTQSRQNIEALMVAIQDCQSPLQAEEFDQRVLDGYLAQMCSERENEFVKRISKEFLQIMLNDLQPIKTVVHQINTNLEMVASEFEDNSVAFDHEVQANAFDPQRLLTEQIESKLDMMAEKVERSVYHSLIKPEGGFNHVMTEYSVLRYNLPNQMRAAAQQVISHENEKLSVEEMIRENDIAPEQLFQWITALINQAKPLVNDCGGEMSLLVGQPTHSGSSQIPRLIEANCRLKNSAINGTDGKITICFEAQDVSMAAVAFRLLTKRPDAVELVKRIHTRDDIDWTSLDDLL